MKLVWRNGSPTNEVKVGDKCKTNRGEHGIVKGIEKPKHAGSTGRVYVEFDGFTHSFYPSVIAAEWIDREDQAAFPSPGRREAE